MIAQGGTSLEKALKVMIKAVKRSSRVVAENKPNGCIQYNNIVDADRLIQALKDEICG